MTLLDKLYIYLGKRVGKQVVIDKRWKSYGHQPFPGFMLLASPRGLWNYNQPLHISSIGLFRKKR